LPASSNKNLNLKETGMTITLDDLKELETQAERNDDRARTLKIITQTIEDGRKRILDPGRNNDTVREALHQVNNYRNARDLVEQEVLKFLPDICRIVELRLAGERRELTVQTNVLRRQLADYFDGNPHPPEKGE